MSELYALGAALSPPDERDHPVSLYMPAAAPRRPAQLDLRPCLQPVRQQGGLGSCVPTAIVSGCLGSQEITHGQPNRILSVAYPYFGARAADHADPGSEGTYPRSVLEFLRQNGTPLEEDCPYSDRNVPVPLGPNGATHAAQNKVAAYARIGLDAPFTTELLDSIFVHGPTQITIDVQPGFDAGSGIIKPGGASRGLHAVTAVGYDEAQRFLIVRNSWGTGWADGGYCKLSFDYTIAEAWAIIAASILADGTTPPHPSQFPWLAHIAQMLGLHIPGLE